MKDLLNDPTVNQGYTPEGAENGRDGIINHKEAYEHRRFKNDKCPNNIELNGFKVFMDNFYQVSIQHIHQAGAKVDFRLSEMS
jgi:hypothetical protein